MDEQKLPWVYRNSSLIILFLCVGPLMLPLVWLHPRMSVGRKLLWSVVIGVLSYFLVLWTAESLKKIGEYYAEIKTMMS